MQNKKRVIFIAGSSYSGSTILNLILANDPKGMSLGEVRSLMHPYRKHHFTLREEFRSDSRWKKIIDDGANKMYQNLFELFPEIDFFIDSSKDPLWIHRQSKMLKKEGYETNVVLIYKSPLEFAQSALKRKQFNWQRKWVSYHQIFFYLINRYNQISYYDFVTTPKESIHSMCNKLQINFVEPKLNFWEKKNFNFFGNNHTNYQAIDGKTDIEERIIDKEYASNFRQIRYKITLADDIQERIVNEAKTNYDIINILDKLGNKKQKYRIGFMGFVKINLKLIKLLNK